MKIQLSKEDKIRLEKQHRKERNSRVCDRIKAVLLSSEGWTQCQIAQALRIHETTVANHLDDYCIKNKLKDESGGSESLLTKEQSEELIRHLEQNTYPTTKEIIKYVYLTYGIKYTQKGMYCWLKRNKFSFKHPKGTPLKHDKEKQVAFKEKYFKIKENLYVNEKIFFMDSVHPTQATKITSGWIRTGVEKVIATVADRKRVNLTGAVNIESMAVFAKDYETVNGHSTIDFLQYLDESTPETDFIHLIADGGRAHTCIEVGAYLGIKDPFNRKYLEDNYQIKLPASGKILSKKLRKKLDYVFDNEPELFLDNEIILKKQITVQAFFDSLRTPTPHHKFKLHILPPYSPNLNPIERVWKVMNEKIRNNVVFETFKLFEDTVLNFFKDVWNTISIDELKSRINDNFEELKPVF